MKINPGRTNCWPGFFVFVSDERIGMDQGTVKFFNATKGFGFVTTKEGEDIFFHKSNVKNTGFREVLLQGDSVQFDIKVEQKGKRAYNISRM
jgi:CspA family cold shock protein